jgi:hypothetical protein
LFKQVYVTICVWICVSINNCDNFISKLRRLICTNYKKVANTILINAKQTYTWPSVTNNWKRKQKPCTVHQCLFCVKKYVLKISLFQARYVDGRNKKKIHITNGHWICVHHTGRLCVCWNNIPFILY